MQHPFIKPNTESIQTFKNLSTDDRINLKQRLFWQAYAVGEEKNYTAMQLVIMYLNQYHYVMSGQCAAESKRYRREIMGERC
jgi:hypothetical protein